MLKFPFFLILVLALMKCGSEGNLSFTEAISIPPGDGAGTALTGTYAVVMKITSNSCIAGGLKTPSDGTSIPVDVEIKQKEGRISFDKLDVKSSGSVSFTNDYKVGGGEIVDRGGEEQNILRLVRATGHFETKNTFTGSGREQLSGQLDNQKVECAFTFNLNGVRK